MLGISDNKMDDMMKTIGAISELLDKKLTLDSNTLNEGTTAVVVVDMINGFIKSGALADSRIGNVIQPIVDTIDVMDQAKLLFINDAHSEKSSEFEVYPSHCLKGSYEGEIVEPIHKYSNSAVIIEKNSTNGFLCDSFQTWFLNEGEQIENYIIMGDCTDICIKQFAISLKAYFNEHNKIKRIIVPINTVETFHLEATHHHGDLMNIMSLYEMEQAGIEIVKSIV